MQRRFETHHEIARRLGVDNMAAKALIIESRATYGSIGGVLYVPTDSEDEDVIPALMAIRFGSQIMVFSSRLDRPQD